MSSTQLKIQTQNFLLKACQKVLLDIWLGLEDCIKTRLKVVHVGKFYFLAGVCEMNIK